MRAAIWSVDKDQPIVRVATMDALLAASAAERRFALILFDAFCIVALVLAATGIDLPRDDEDLAGADAYVREVFDRSLGRPMLVKERPPARKAKRRG